MAISSTSSIQSVSQDLLQQLSLQQAQRAAQQAEQRARSLRSQASDAQTTADQAQENARTLAIQAGNAQSQATQSEQNLARVESLVQLPAQLNSVASALSSGLHSLQSQVKVPQAKTQVNAPPVVNGQGQTIGKVINVTA